MFIKGSILKGPGWNEPIEVIDCTVEEGIGFLVRAKGLKSNKFYEDYVFEEDLHAISQLPITSTQPVSEMNEAIDVGELLRYHFLKMDIATMKTKATVNVTPLPHQIEAVYSRMLGSSSVRYLLADDPGAGKTIMSGMLISEMIARGDAERILILVPPLVLKQWQEELKSKFGEEFDIVNRDVLKTSTGNPFVDNDKILCSLYWGMRDEIKAEILSADYDLVIVDEAHKMAAYTESKQKKKSKRRTKLYRLGESLALKSQHFLMLTATPHKGDRENYRHLMSLIDEDLFANVSGRGQLNELAEPYVIRRLKESMVQFDGTPLFPKRLTSTVTFELSPVELELYEAVTEYVKKHFDRAKTEKNRAVTFAMMILQRRSSSSLEAIYLSLKRRLERLVEQREELQLNEDLEIEDLDELNEEDEAEVVGATDYIDPLELEIEIEELEKLIDLAETIRSYGIEYKYDALHKTLFGFNGLIANGEKLLIFTESKDTLNYLKRRLEEEVGEVAIIEGSMNMDKRSKSVELFRNQVPIMIATDAGGESINLQFCNQMVNYDIPWNPNKLEQRMGRIHRIGQKNDVNIFNLVAGNTREGQVMSRLLTKLENMRTDLGTDLVYDFLGEVLEDFELRLDELMSEALESREHLDDVISKMDKVLSAEHEQLIEMAKNEQIADAVNLPGVRQTFNEATLNAVPRRVYGHFLRSELTKNRMSPTERYKDVFRISYLPASVKRKAKELGVKLPKNEYIVITTNPKLASDDVQLIKATHPLISLLMNLADETLYSSQLTSYQTNLQTPEPFDVVLVKYGIRDGNNKTIEQKLRLFGLRTSGELIEISPYWLTSNLDATFLSVQAEDSKVLVHAKKKILLELQKLKSGRSNKGIQKRERLEAAFDHKINTLQDRIHEYNLNDVDNRNSAIINKAYSDLTLEESRKKERLENIDREATCNLQKIEVVAQLKARPETSSWRVIASDYDLVVEMYEDSFGRQAMIQPALGLVDFYSIGKDGETRFIILANRPPNKIPYIEDYEDILENTYIYVVNDLMVKEIIPLSK